MPLDYPRFVARIEQLDDEGFGPDEIIEVVATEFPEATTDELSAGFRRAASELSEE